jgi:hypothetical protein
VLSVLAAWVVVLPAGALNAAGVPEDNPAARQILDAAGGFLWRAVPDIPKDSGVESYYIQVAAGGMRLEEDLGWGAPCLKRLEIIRAALDELKALVNPDAARQIDKLAAPLKEIAKSVSDERVAKARANLDKVSLQITPYKAVGVRGDAPWLRLVQGAFNAGEVKTTGVIDPKQAGRIVDFLEKSGFFSRAAEQDVFWGPNTFGLALGGVEWLQADLGWDESMLKQVQALRDVLEGDAAAKTDVFLAGAKEAIENPRVEPVRVSEAKAKALNDERAAVLKKNIDEFSLGLHYWGQAEKPFYSILLHVNRQGYGKSNDKFETYRVIDRQDALALIDCLHDLGVLGHSEERDPQAEMRFLRAQPHGPCYELSLTGGTWLVLNLDWEKPMLEKLLAIRKVLKGDPADDMDHLLERLSPYIRQWTGKPYEPAK